MKYGVATYGMNVWSGGDYDPEERWARLREIGYEGVEHLSAVSGDDAVGKAARMHKLGMDFATVSAPTPELTIQ